MELSDSYKEIKSFLVCVAISFWLYWLWSRRSFYMLSLKWPGLMGPPIFGVLVRIKTLNNLFPAMHDIFQDCKQYTISVWIGLFPALATADPEYIEKILSSSDMLSKSKSLYKRLHEAFGGILSSPVTEWHRNRKMLNPSFSHKVLLSFLPIFNKAKNVAVKKFSTMVDNDEHKIVEMLQIISLGSSVETTMGKAMQVDDHLDETLTEKYSFVLKQIALQSFSSFLHFDGLLGLYSKYRRTVANLQNFVRELAEQRLNKLNEPMETDNIKQSGEENSEKDEDALKKTPNIFIDQVLQIYRKGLFSMHDALSEANTMLASSFETTASGVYTTLVMLAMHPEIQERLYEEIVSVFPEKIFEMEYEHLQLLPYMDMVINETLRLAPPVPMIGRQAVKDTQLTKDLLLPKNMQIIISIYHLHRRTDIWGANANQFDPDHFLPQNMAERHSHAYMPFSKGARNCIGWRYALFSIKIMLAGLLRNYRFATSFKYDDLKFLDYIVLKYLEEPMLQISQRP